jgi:hypothetical protein
MGGDAFGTELHGDLAAKLRNCEPVGRGASPP